MKISFLLNGSEIREDRVPGLSLLEFLREQELYSAKYGCDHGECGACAVLIDDKAVNSCLVLLHSLEGKRVETLESLNDHRQLTPLQNSFLEEGAVQCGYCTPGMLISLEALKREHSKVDQTKIRDALSANLCRCTGYVKPLKAALKIFEAGPS